MDYNQLSEIYFIFKILKNNTMKILLFFLLFVTFSYSQTGNINSNILVDYEFVINFSNEVSVTIAKLQIGNSTATYNVFHNNNIEVSDDFKYDKKLDSYNKEIDLSDGSGMYMKTNLMDSTLIHTSNIGKTKYLIHENLPVMNWKLEDDEKQINDFICKKAILSFRGRDYIAWYNPKIPVPFGPWKFIGLPGLVLEISDMTNTFTWTALEIRTIEKKKNYTIDKSKFINVSLKEYIALRDKSDDNFNKMLRSKVPKGAIITDFKTKNNGIETKYEW